MNNKGLVHTNSLFAFFLFIILCAILAIVVSVGIWFLVSPSTLEEEKDYYKSQYLTTCNIANNYAEMYNILVKYHPEVDVKANIIPCESYLLNKDKLELLK